MNIQDIQLDINKSPSVGKWVTIGQGDKGGTTIRATVYDNGAAAALAGMSARFEMRMPNATYFEDANCTVSGNVITYVVDESHAALYAGGGSEAYFSLHDGDTAIYSTERFHVRVARAASDGANPGRAWTNGIEEWLEDASDELDGYVASADARVGATINAANAAVEGMRSDVDEAISGTEEAIDRAEDAIDAIGDISELAVPVMSKDVRGGAKLDEHGGLVLRDEKLGIGSLVQESDGIVRGGIAELTAKGHAEQDGTPTPDNPVPIQVVRGRNLLDPMTQRTVAGITVTPRPDGSYVVSGTATQDAIINNSFAEPLPAGTYTLSAGNAMAAGTSGATYLRVSTSSSGLSQSEVALNVANNATTFTASNPLYTWAIRVASGDTLNNLVIHPQLELGSVVTPYVPYGHVGIEAHTRNLFDVSALINSPWNGNVVNMQRARCLHAIYLPVGTAITVSFDAAFFNTYVFSVIQMNTDFPATTPVSDTNWRAQGITLTTVAPYIGIIIKCIDNGSVNLDDLMTHYIQVELGSTTTAYQPYYHATTPIPLPQRGWVAGLPDGTADSLRLDGAGHVEWTLPTSEIVLDGSETYFYSSQYFLFITNVPSIKNPIYNGFDCLSDRYAVVRKGLADMNNDEMIVSSLGVSNNPTITMQNTTYDNVADFTAELAVNPVTVLCPLATPVTEDCGYVEDWPTDIPEGAVITIPELDAVNIRYFVDSAVAELARQWYARANSEYADRLTALEQAVAELATS